MDAAANLKRCKRVEDQGDCAGASPVAAAVAVRVNDSSSAESDHVVEPAVGYQIANRAGCHSWRATNGCKRPCPWPQCLEYELQPDSYYCSTIWSEPPKDPLPDPAKNIYSINIVSLL